MDNPGLKEIKLLIEMLDKDADLVKSHASEVLREVERLENLDREEVRSIKHALGDALSCVGQAYNALIRVLIVLKEHNGVDDSHVHLKEKLALNGTVEDHIKVFVDGSCLGNPGPGGWASLIIDEYGFERIISGGEPHTTNNRMELTSVIEALRRIDRSKKVIVYTDSRYIRDAFEYNHIERWISNGWRTSSKKEVANRELWEVLYEIVKSFKNIKFVWVEGHARGGFLSEKNNRVDLEARREAKRMKDSLLLNGSV